MSLAGDHEHRPGTRDDEEPLGYRDADRHAAGDGAQHEAGCDGREVHHGLVLQPCAVRDGQRGVGGYDQRKAPRRDECKSDRRDEQCHAHELREPDRDGARCDGAVTLRRVRPVGDHVEGVVQVVGAARRETEADERDRALGERLALVEDACGSRRSEDEDVLQPLLRSREPKQGYGQAGTHQISSGS